MNTSFITLDWDTAFFGFKVARILIKDFSEKSLETTLRVLKEDGFRLVYLLASYNIADSDRIVRNLGGLLVDHKVTFTIELKDIKDTEPISASTFKILTHPGGWPDEQLRLLALQSGEYSRFRLDQNFPYHLFEKLYSVWIERSVSREIAQDVLIVKEGDTCLGMVTIGEKNGCGDIGLVAVESAARGKGVGKTLIHAANRWFVSNGYRKAQVITQEINAGACRLYETCGYHLESSEAVYHFWM